MKSLTAVCQTGAAAMPAINASGRIARHAHQRGDGENAEMKMYLSKLKDLVPFMPKNRKLSKLEIIQHVIDYICDLQTELEAHPDVNGFDAASALNNYAAAAAAVTAHSAANLSAADNVNQAMLAERLTGEQQQQQHSSPLTPARQPLVDRQTPNTILPANLHNNNSIATTPSMTAAAAVPTATPATSNSAPLVCTQDFPHC